MLARFQYLNEKNCAALGERHWRQAGPLNPKPQPLWSQCNGVRTGIYRCKGKADLRERIKHSPPASPSILYNSVSMLKLLLVFSLNSFFGIKHGGFKFWLCIGFLVCPNKWPQNWVGYNYRHLFSQRMTVYRETAQRGQAVLLATQQVGVRAHIKIQAKGDSN